MNVLVGRQPRCKKIMEFRAETGLKQRGHSSNINKSRSATRTPPPQQGTGRACASKNNQARSVVRTPPRQQGTGRACASKNNQAQSAVLRPTRPARARDEDQNQPIPVSFNPDSLTRCQCSCLLRFFRSMTLISRNVQTVMKISLASSIFSGPIKTNSNPRTIIAVIRAARKFLIIELFPSFVIVWHAGRKLTSSQFWLICIGVQIRICKISFAQALSVISHIIVKADQRISDTF